MPNHNKRPTTKDMQGMLPKEPYGYYPLPGEPYGSMASIIARGKQVEWEAE
jgi:hypothetical protein